MANVSIATVSNILNKKPGSASPEKVEAVLNAAKTLNYQPNTLAKSLRNQKSRTIGIIAEDLTVYQTSEIINGIEEYCEQYHYDTILANMRLFKRFGNDYTVTQEHEVLFDNAVSSLMSKQVEGFIYIGYHCREIPFTPFCSNLPFIYVYCIPKSKEYPYILLDDEQASTEIGRTLIAHGHRDIGLITGPISSLNSQSRLAGFQKALFEASIPYNVSHTMIGDWTRKSGYFAAKELIPRGVTAIYAFNDMMASGVYSYCIDSGIMIGQDISLFGYDNQIIVDAYYPPLSSVEPHLNEMGHKAGELVMTQIQGHSVCEKKYIIPYTIHIRKSLCKNLSK